MVIKGEREGRKEREQGGKRKKYMIFIRKSLFTRAEGQVEEGREGGRVRGSRTGEEGEKG